jgi:transcriptional regulator with XRE-family HTH domain
MVRKQQAPKHGTGERLEILRKDNSLSQDDLAQRLETSRSMVNMWERGEREIKASDVVAIAEMFNVTADYLLGLTNVKSLNAGHQAVSKVTGLSEDVIKDLALFVGSDAATFVNEMIRGAIQLLKQRGFHR